MPVSDTGDPVGGLLLLAATVCTLGASLTVCYMIWLKGWEGWEAWNERTGLNEGEALATKEERLRSVAEKRQH